MDEARLGVVVGEADPPIPRASWSVGFQPPLTARRSAATVERCAVGAPDRDLAQRWIARRWRRPDAGVHLDAGGAQPLARRPDLRRRVDRRSPARRHWPARRRSHGRRGSWRTRRRARRRARRTARGTARAADASITPGRSLPANAIGRSWAPVARTTRRGPDVMDHVGRAVPLVAHARSRRRRCRVAVVFGKGGRRPTGGSSTTWCSSTSSTRPPVRDGIQRRRAPGGPCPDHQRLTWRCVWRAARGVDGRVGQPRRRPPGGRPTRPSTRLTIVAGRSARTTAPRPRRTRSAPRRRR